MSYLRNTGKDKRKKKTNVYCFFSGWTVQHLLLTTWSSWCSQIRLGYVNVSAAIEKLWCINVSADELCRGFRLSAVSRVAHESSTYERFLQWCVCFFPPWNQRHYCAFLYTVSIRKGCFSKVSQLLFKGKRQKHTVCSWRAICSLWRAPLASVSPEGAAPVWWRWGSIDWLFWSASTRAEENNLLHNSFF